jgi:hypothetical protein
MNLSNKSYKILFITANRWHKNLYTYNGKIPLDWENYSKIRIEDNYIDYNLKLDNEESKSVQERDPNISWTKKNIINQKNITNEVDYENYDKLICIYD